MDLSSPKSTEEAVIAALAIKAQGWEALLESARTVKPNFTKQALYIILRRLMVEEVVVKHGTQFSLSNLWIGKMADFFALAQGRHGIVRGATDFLSLSDGDKISYSFKSPADADRFWAHAFGVLMDAMDPAEPVFIYNPHQWFIYARQESELHLFERLKRQKRNLWVTAGHRDELDRLAKRFFDGTYLQYHMLERPFLDKEHYYVNVFGDFIIEASIESSTAEAIDTFYKNNHIYSESTMQTLKNIVSKGRTKLSISRNAGRAGKMKRVFEKHFYKARGAFGN